MTTVPVSGVEVSDLPAAAWATAAADAVADGFGWLGWLSAVDDAAAGVLVVLLLLARPDASGTRLLRTTVPRDGGRLPSVRGLLPGAAWHERETAEMFGMVFDGGDPRPLLLPAGEAAHPLRADVPLGARQVAPWPGEADPGGRRRRSGPPGVVPGWGDPA